MILIVDDEQAVRLSIGLALRKARMDFEAVGTEAEAMAAVRDPKIRAVVLDMNLRLSTTGEQGIEMLRKIKVLRPELPVIMLTAWGTIPLAVTSMGYGAADFMTKPWSNEDLVRKLRRVLAESDAAQASEAPVETLDALERRAVEEALDRCGGNLSTAAQQLGITRQALYRRMQKFGLGTQL